MGRELKLYLDSRKGETRNFALGGHYKIETFMEWQV